MEYNSISYGTSSIDFSLQREQRKSLGIKVYPDGGIVVTAPEEASYEDIVQKVKSKALWIYKQKDFFMLFEPRAGNKIYESGESFLYLGKRYRLKLIESEEHSVKLKSGYIYVSIKDKTDKKTIEKELKKWYQLKAKIHFQNIFESRKLLVSELTDKQPKLQLKWFNNRWGSCFENGLISLNYELIKAPKECIDYVVVHEMCHLVYHNHSSKFYELLESKLSNWKNLKDKLEVLLA